MKKKLLLTTILTTFVTSSATRAADTNAVLLSLTNEVSLILRTNELSHPNGRDKKQYVENWAQIVTMCTVPGTSNTVKFTNQVELGTATVRSFTREDITSSVEQKSLPLKQPSPL